MRMGVPKSAKARMNTSSAAARIVGIERRRTTLKNRRSPVQPRLDDASMRLLSRLANMPFIYIITSGYSFVA